MKKTPQEWYDSQMKKGIYYIVYPWKFEKSCPNVNEKISLKEFEEEYCV